MMYGRRKTEFSWRNKNGQINGWFTELKQAWITADKFHLDSKSNLNKNNLAWYVASRKKNHVDKSICK